MESQVWVKVSLFLKELRCEDIKEMPPNNLRKSVAESTDFIMFTLNKMRRLFSGSS